MTLGVQTDLFQDNENPGSSLEQMFVTWHVALTGYTPFLWQQRLFHRFIENELPSALDLPTGLGKTSAMTIWLLARAFNPNLPRRLAYVVDRRSVVDQATTVAEELRDRISALPDLQKRLNLDNKKAPCLLPAGQTG